MTTKNIYIKPTTDGYYKVTNNGKTVADNLPFTQAQAVAENLSRETGKKVKTTLDHFGW